MNKIIFIILILGFGIGISQYTPDHSINENFILVKKDSFYLDIGDNLYGQFNHLQTDSANLLYFLSYRSNEIHIYPHSFNSYTKNINIPAHLGNIKSFFIGTDGKFFLKQFKYGAYYIYISNKNGELYDSLQVEFRRLYPGPSIANENPVYTDGETIYMTGFSGGVYKEEKKGERPVIIRYNLQTDELTYLGDYPSNYYKYNYGGLGYRKIYNAVNYDEKIIVMSFPSCPEIYWFDLEEKKMHRSSSSIATLPEIPPLSKDKSWYGALAKQSYVEYYYSNPSYAEIYYDNYRDVYYRILESPNEQFNYHEKESYKKAETVIVYDKNFEVIAKKRIEDRIFSHNSFITEEGIYFQAFSKISNPYKWYLFSLEKK